MSKHTPGPWVISYTHDDNLSMAIDDEPGMQGERNYDLVTVTHGDPDELLANAVLISKAPAMYELLQRILYAGEWYTSALEIDRDKDGRILCGEIEELLTQIKEQTK